MTRAPGQRFRQRALQLFVFDLVARLQGGIVALEPRHRDRFAGFDLPHHRGNRVLRGGEHGFAGGPDRDLGNQRRRDFLVPRENHIFFRVEIVEEAAARNVGGGRDVVERGRFKPAFEEQRHRRPGQPLARLLPLAFPQAGCRLGGSGF